MGNSKVSPLAEGLEEMRECKVCGGIGDHKVHAADGDMWLCCLCYIKFCDSRYQCVGEYIVKGEGKNDTRECEGGVLRLQDRVG